ncbi:MAG: efflux RND transporter periplasmic adaptor subunit [Nitrospirales bacterium]
MAVASAGLTGILGLLLTGLSGCGDQQAAQPPAGPPPTPVRIAPIKQEEVQQSVTLIGAVQPWKRSIVAGEVAGLVDSFRVKEGQAVEKGQLLASLDTKTWRIQLDAALASRREGQVRHEQALQDMERLKTLVEKDLVTKKEYDDAVAQESALRQRLSQLDTEIRRVRDRLAKARITAPFTGVVVREHTEIGQWIEEGGPVVELVDLSPVQVQVPLPERFVQHVRVGNTGTAVFDGLPGFQAQGQIDAIVAQADPASRTFPIKVKIPNPDGRIKSGMVARVTLAVGDPYLALLVPKDALVLRGQEKFVFLVENGKAVQRQVTAGMALDDAVEVNGDLQEGMSVVVQGNERLFPGQPVRILNQS